MQVARSHTLSMLDAPALRAVVELEKPQFIVPTARAARLTMDREGIRRLANTAAGQN